jgi:hypothetical protein
MPGGSTSASAGPPAAIPLITPRPATGGSPRVRPPGRTVAGTGDNGGPPRAGDPRRVRYDRAVTIFYDIDGANGRLAVVGPLLETLRTQRADVARLGERLRLTEADEADPAVAGVLRARSAVVDQMEVPCLGWMTGSSCGHPIRAHRFPALVNGRQVWLCWRLGDGSTGGTFLDRVESRQPSRRWLPRDGATGAGGGRREDAPSRDCVAARPRPRISDGGPGRRGVDQRLGSRRTPRGRADSPAHR